VLESDVTERREPTYDIPDPPDTITLNAAGLRRRDTESVSSIGPAHRNSASISTAPSLTWRSPPAS
jgi:hypothetical protein